MTSRTPNDGANERTSLLRNESNHHSEEYGTEGCLSHHDYSVNGDIKSSSADDQVEDGPPWRNNLVLLLGAFLVNADTSMLYGIYRQVASEYDELQSASWLITGNIMGTIVSQPLFGKLSDIYGRKALLIFTCVCAGIGAVIGGSGVSFGGVIAGRVISGIANAGMSVLVSTIIVDNVPFSKIAMWRSIVYASNQIGRSMGLPLGGWITDATNWRWAILYQVPLYLFIVVFIWRRMDFIQPEADNAVHGDNDGSRMSKFKRIDFPGAISLGIANFSLLLSLDQAPRNLNILKNLLAIVPLGIWIVFLASFVVIELYVAAEPILPIRLLLTRRNVLSAYLVQIFQGALQVGYLTAIPLYFRVTESASNFQVSMHLLVLTLGAMTGTIFSGAFITRTGRYRRLVQITQLMSIATATVIFLRWRGSTSWLEALYAFSASMGFSVALSATFIALNDGLPAAHTAVATSGFYLCMNIGSNVGVGISNVITQALVRQRLIDRLAGRPGWRKLIHDITSNINNIERLPAKIRMIAVNAYSNALVHVWLFFIIIASLSFLSSLLLRKEQLHNSPKKDQASGNASGED